MAQIFCEINFGDCKSAKSPILIDLEAVNLDFHESLHFLKAEISPTKQFRASKIAKSGIFSTSRFSKIDFM